jgi:hypothetical protein
MRTALFPASTSHLGTGFYAGDVVLSQNSSSLSSCSHLYRLLLPRREQQQAPAHICCFDKTRPHFQPSAATSQSAHAMPVFQNLLIKSLRLSARGPSPPPTPPHITSTEAHSAMSSRFAASASRSAYPASAFFLLGFARWICGSVRFVLLPSRITSRCPLAHVVWATALLACHIHLTGSGRAGAAVGPTRLGPCPLQTQDARCTGGSWRYNTHASSAFGCPIKGLCPLASFDSRCSYK